MERREEVTEEGLQRAIKKNEKDISKGREWLKNEVEFYATSNLLDQVRKLINKMWTER